MLVLLDVFVTYLIIFFALVLYHMFLHRDD